MWMLNKLVAILFLWNTITIVNAELKLCSVPVNKTQLCKRMDNYIANKPPRKLNYTDTPAILTPIIYLENVLEIDHDKKSITIYVTIDMEWVDSEIGVSYPEGIEYVFNDFQKVHICSINVNNITYTLIILGSIIIVIGTTFIKQKMLMMCGPQKLFFRISLNLQCCKIMENIKENLTFGMTQKLKKCYLWKP